MRNQILFTYRILVFFLTLMVLSPVGIWAQTPMQVPYMAEATTGVNVRQGPGTSYAVKGSLSKGDRVSVTEVNSYNKWVKVYSSYCGNGWVYGQYLRPCEEETKQEVAVAPSKESSHWHFSWGWVWTAIGYIIMIAIGIIIFSGIWDYVVGSIYLLLWIGKYIFWFINLPWRISNALQRYLAKPWMLLFHRNHFSDKTNEALRAIFDFLKIPLYILLTPLRFVNAVYFNLFVHLPYELYNYLVEIILPIDADDFLEWIIYLPVRVVRYGVYHASLTIIESLIWTAVDTVIPALTLYHGTNETAAEYILASPDRTGWSERETGIWKVGTGNFAGDGIYFAPARGTSTHYARGVLIVCRVTLGKTLDLGLAPNFVYDDCGHRDAHAATQWGLQHGYVTGEWWRGGRGARWWEYCLYDWQNRYNFSWRIRPLYAIDLENGLLHRTPCGMSHWLFRKMVLKDIALSIKNAI